MNSPLNNNNVFIHYNPERTDYSLTGEELEMIKNASQNDWKDYSIACFSIGFPFLLNAFFLSLSLEDFVLDLKFIINFVCGFIGITLGFVFWNVWKKTKNNLDSIIKKIKSKPIIEFTPKIANIAPNLEDKILNK